MMKKNAKKPGLISFLGKYKVLVLTIISLSLIVNILGLALPRINSRAIDSLQTQNYDRDGFLIIFAGIATVILVLGLVQVVISNYTAEKIAAELRKQIIEKISKQTFSYINSISTSKLLTNLTADTDAVKNFINQALVLIFAAVVQLIGSGILLLVINWKLAVPIILTLPIIIFAFGYIFKKLGKFFQLSQEVIDKLNRVINESIVGSALIRVINAKSFETKKFTIVNDEAKFLGIKIITGFAGLFPLINLIVSAGFLIVLGYGGVQIIDKTLSPGDFSSFFSYIFIFIGPVILIGFLSTEIQRAFASYTRIREVIDAKEPEQLGTITKEIKGNIKLSDVNLTIGQKIVLKDISLEIKPQTRVAIIGPTGAGKTQLFYLITGLVSPTSGNIKIDGTKIEEYDTNSLYSQIGMVFQDSMIFNTTVRDNIAFRSNISDELIWKALETADLKDFVNLLPNKLDSLLTERGTSLSGGQKQRLTLARALALNPKILLLDDFTARVDINTEKIILANLAKNYPQITIVSITQKIASIEDFDNIILVMEGELLATGKHNELLEKSLEYQLIFNSQQQLN